VPNASLIFLAFIATAMLLSGCGTRTQLTDGAFLAPVGKGGHKKIGKPYRVAGKIYYPLSSAAGYNQTGVASWYGRDFHGRLTANGERYDMHAMTAAHTTLPLPTLARVTNLENGRHVVVRINDRGPFVKSRLIDLSYAAAKVLGYTDKGTVRVRVQALQNSASSPKPDPSHVIVPTVRPLLKKSQMYVQVGAFASMENADRLRGSLAGLFPSAHVSSLSQEAQQLYRVRIGPFWDMQQIEHTVIELQQHGQTETVIMAE
jgi:rare lipoprotein A